MSDPVVSPVQGEAVETACDVMHDAYERAAVGAGWETQEASRKPWADVPEANKATMRAAVGALLEWLDAPVAGSPVHEGEDERRCGYTVTDRDFIEQPCNRPATGWRWYQDCDHEDALDVACDFHANEGGQRIHDLEARLRDALAENQSWEQAYMSACEYGHDENQRAQAAEAKLAAVEALISEAEAGAGIVITPGFTTYYSVDTGLLRAALDASES